MLSNYKLKIRTPWLSGEYECFVKYWTLVIEGALYEYSETCL